MATPPPQLRSNVPLLERSPTELQVGTDQGLILPAKPAVKAALKQLNGTTPVGRIAQESGLSRSTIEALVAQLHAAGLLITAPATPPVLVRLIGAGRLGRAFAEAYALHPPGRLQLVDPTPPPTGLYAQPLLTAAETLRAHLRAQGHRQISTAGHWFHPEGPAPQLTVIALDRLECDRAITDTLLRADQPHLFLRPLLDGMIVGPLVVPGNTCCTRCMDLVRTRDRAWPTLLAQLCLTPCPPAPDLVGWAVETALVQLRAWFTGSEPETLGATLEIRQNTWTLAQRHWPQHPDCGCADLAGTG